MLFGLVQPGVIGAFIGGNDIQQETNFVWAQGLSLHLHLLCFQTPQFVHFQVGQGLINRRGHHPGSLTCPPPFPQGTSETTIQKTALSYNPVTWCRGIQQYNALLSNLNLNSPALESGQWWIVQRRGLSSARGRPLALAQETFKKSCPLLSQPMTLHSLWQYSKGIWTMNWGIQLPHLKHTQLL